MFSFASLVILAVAVSAVPAPAPQAAAGSFVLQNGKDAIALNEKFKSLTANSPCTEGEAACVGDSFAQCANGKLALSQCAGGTICAALPLVNKAGTSVTCTTAADRDARIAATGATGSGSGSGAAPAPAPASGGNNNGAAAPAAAPAPAPASGDFKAQNGKDAQALNEKFASLTADSACQAGENACVNDQFAQCVGGKFQATSCGGNGLICAALPLVNKPGTSVTCTTAADRDARIATALGTTANTDAGKGAAAPAPAPAAQPAAPAPAPAKPATNASGDFKAQNGRDATALNEKFSNLSADSTCTDGKNACVGDQFAQCVGGQFALTPCGGGLICAALPLVNKPGTSVTCTTAADRDARIAASGA